MDLYHTSALFVMRSRARKTERALPPPRCAGWYDKAAASGSEEWLRCAVQLRTAVPFAVLLPARRSVAGRPS